MRVKKLPANAAGRDFVVGDIHGNPDLVLRLLEAADFDRSKDRLFSVGDLIDRGPDSVGAIKLLEEPWFYAVMGNHEQMMLAAAGGGMDAWGLWIENGGDWALSASSELQELTARIIDLPLAIVIGDGPERFNVIHGEFYGSDAELEAGEFTDQQFIHMLWGRARIEQFDTRRMPESPTYCGHTIVTAPMKVGTAVYFDTGAYLLDGRLTMLEPKTHKTWTAARDTWS